MKTACLALLLFLSPLLSAAEVSDPRIEQATFGALPDGSVVTQYTLHNHSGMTVKLIDYGAIITAILVPDANGVAANVVVGSDSLQDYVGRFPAAAVQGRYANRIANGRFVLDGAVDDLLGRIRGVGNRLGLLSGKHRRSAGKGETGQGDDEARERSVAHGLSPPRSAVELTIGW